MSGFRLPYLCPEGRERYKKIIFISSREKCCSLHEQTPQLVEMIQPLIWHPLTSLHMNTKTLLKKWRMMHTIFIYVCLDEKLLGIGSG